MLVIEVVTASFALLVASAWGQEPQTLGGSSPSSAIYDTSPGFDPGPDIGTQVEISGVGDIDFKRNEIFGKALDSEENAEEYDEDDFDNDDEDDYDSYEYDLSEETGQDDDKAESKERFKRKIIFRGGGGGGIYSRSGRRQQHGYGEEDPYGRRRDNHGGRGPSDSWPYRRQDTPYQEPSQKTPSTTGSTTRSESAPVYGTTRRIADEGSSRPSSSSSSSAPNPSGKRTKTERRETSKVKISKELKTEIAQYAVQHGAQRAADHFQDRIGKKLRVKKIEKFVKRYQSKQ